MSNATPYRVVIGTTGPGLRLEGLYTLEAAYQASKSLDAWAYMLARDTDAVAISIPPGGVPQPEAAADAVDLRELVLWFQAHEHAPARGVLAVLQRVGPFLAAEVAAMHRRGDARPSDAVLDLCEALAGLKS